MTDDLELGMRKPNEGLGRPSIETSMRPPSVANASRSVQQDVTRQSDAARDGPGKRSAARRAGKADAKGDTASKEPDDELSEWVLNLHQQDILGAKNAGDWRARPGTTMHLEASFAALNRMRMRKLQIQLTQRLVAMRFNEEITGDWEELLAKYVQATRDDDYMRECIRRGKGGLDDPFVVTTRRILDRDILKAVLGGLPDEKFDSGSLDDQVGLLLRDEPEDPGRDEPDGAEDPGRAGGGGDVLRLAKVEERDPQPIGGLRTERSVREWWRAFLKRIVFAIVGGAFLVVPMWIMVKLQHTHPDLPLIVTTVAVVLCGVAAARMLEKPDLVLSITAAYAAVLVVFVGTNSSSPGQV